MIPHARVLLVDDVPFQAVIVSIPRAKKMAVWVGKIPNSPIPFQLEYAGSIDIDEDSDELREPEIDAKIISFMTSKKIKKDLQE